MFSPRFPPTTRRAFHPTRSSPSPPTTLQDGLPGGFGTATSTSETAETSLFSDYGPGEGGGNSWEHHGLDFSLGPVQGVDGVDLGSIRMRGGIQKYHQQGGGGEGGEGEGWGASFTDDLVVVDEDVEEESEEDEIRTTRRSFYPDRDRTARQSTTARSRLTGTSSPLLSPAPPKSTEPLIDFLAPSVPGTPEPRFAPLPPPPSAQLQHLRSEIDSRTQVPQAYTQQQQHPPPANLDAISQLRAAFSRARADVPYSAPSLDQPKPEAKVRDWLTDTSSSHSNDPSPSAPAPSTSNIPPSNRSRPHIIPHPNETRSARGFPPPSSRPPTSPVYPAHTHHSHTQPRQHTQISVHHSLPPHLEEDDIDPIARDQDPLPSESESPPTPPPRLPTTFGRLTNHRRSPSPPLVDDYPQKAAHPSSSSPPTKSPQQPQTALQAFLASHPKPSLIERKPVPPPPPPAETEDEPELESDLGSFFPLGRSSTPKNLSQSFSNPNHSRYSTSNLSSSRASAAISRKGKEREVVTTPPLPSPPPSRPTPHSTPPKTIVSSPSRRRRQAIAAAANPITSTFSASPESPFVPSHSLKRSTETAPTPQRLHFDFPSSQPSPLTTTISARHSSSQLRRTSSNASSSSSRSHPQDRSFERIQRDLEADPVLSHSNTSSRSSLTKSRNRRVTIVEPVRSPPRQPQQQTSDEEGGEALTRSPRRPGGDGYRSRSQYDDQGEDSHRQPSFIVDPSFARQRPRPNTSSSHSPRLSSSRTAAVPPSLPPSAPTRRSSHPPAPPSFARPVDQHLSDRESTSFADASSTGSSSADQSASMTAHLEAARRRKRMFASPIKGGKMDRSIGLEEEKVEEEDGGNQGKKKEEEGEEIVTKAEEDREEMESEQKCLVDERGAGGEEVAQDEEKRASTSAFIPPIAATSSSTLPSNPVPSPPTPPSPHPSSSTFPIVPSSPRQTSSHSHSNPTAGFSSPPSPPPPPPPPESHSTPLRQPKRFLHTSHLLAAPSTPGGPGSPIVPGGWGWTPGGGLKDKARRESQLRRVDEGSSLGTQQEEEELDGDGEEGGEEGTEGREKEAFESSPPMTTIPLSSTLPPAHRQPVTLSSSMGSGPGVGGSLSPIGSLGRMRSPSPLNPMHQASSSRALAQQPSTSAPSSSFTPIPSHSRPSHLPSSLLLQFSASAPPQPTFGASPSSTVPSSVEPVNLSSLATDRTPSLSRKRLRSSRTSNANSSFTTATTSATSKRRGAADRSFTSLSLLSQTSSSSSTPSKLRLAHLRSRLLHTTTNIEPPALARVERMRSRWEAVNWVQTKVGRGREGWREREERRIRELGWVGWFGWWMGVLWICSTLLSSVHSVLFPSSSTPSPYHPALYAPSFPSSSSATPLYLASNFRRLPPSLSAFAIPGKIRSGWLVMLQSFLDGQEGLDGNVQGWF